jgi:Holliday junction resolvasome RuvABC endonuclease subunit
MPSDATSTTERVVLGIRSAPAAIHWAVVSGTLLRPVLEASGTAEAPSAYEEGEALVWIRDKVGHIINDYAPGRVAIRYAERKAQGSNTDAAKARCRVEGVVLELASSRNLDVVTGTMNTFAKYTPGSPKEDLQRNDLRGLDWSDYRDSKLREAILVAASLLPVS